MIFQRTRCLVRAHASTDKEGKGRHCTFREEKNGCPLLFKKQFYRSKWLLPNHFENFLSTKLTAPWRSTPRITLQVVWWILILGVQSHIHPFGYKIAIGELNVLEKTACIYTRTNSFFPSPNLLLKYWKKVNWNISSAISMLTGLSFSWFFFHLVLIWRIIWF